MNAHKTIHILQEYYNKKMHTKYIRMVAFSEGREIGSGKWG